MAATLTKDMYLSQANDVINALKELNNNAINDKAAELNLLLNKFFTERVRTADLKKASDLLVEIQTMAKAHMQNYAEKVEKYLNTDSAEFQALATMHEKEKALREAKAERQFLRETAGNRYDIAETISFYIVMSLCITAACIIPLFIPILSIGIFVGVVTFMVGFLLSAVISTVVGQLAAESKFLKSEQLLPEIERLKLELYSLNDLKNTAEPYIQDEDYQDRFALLSESLTSLQDEVIEVLQQRNVEDAEWIDVKVQPNLVKKSKHSFFTAVEPTVVEPANNNNTKTATMANC